MSELSEIWSFLFLSVAKLFNFSLDAICTIIFMVGSIPPWRWEETYLILNGQDQRHHGGWKGTCIAHLVITIGDLFLFVFALLSLTSPMRWAMLYDALFTPEQQNLRNTKRGRLFTLFPLTICDWFAYFFGFWGLFSPIGMQFFMFAAFRYPEVEFRKLDSAEVDRVMISVGCQTMLDLLIHILGLPLILLAPSVWSGLYQGLVVINSLEPPERTLALENLWLEFYRTKRWLIAATACHAVIDIFTSPFLLLALLSPWRNSLIRALIWPPQPASTELVNAENSQVAATDRIIANNSTYQGVISSTRQAQLLELQQLQAIQAFDYHYNAVLRLNIMYQGLLAILDFFLLPMMLPLYFTQYRYRQMKEDLFGPSSTETTNKEDKNTNRNTASIKIWTHRELFLILQQFSLLMSDMVLIALPLAVLFITRFRWNLVANIFKNYEEEKLFLKKSSLLYTVVLKQFVLLLLDGLCFPLVVIVFLTGYRWRVLSLLFANPKIKNSDLLMHGHIVMNFLLIFHDALIYSPIILVLGFLSLHRMVYSVLIIIDRLFHRDEVASKALSTPAFKDSDEVITQEQSYKLLKDETAVNTETSSPSRLDRDSSPSGQRVRLEEGMKVEGNDRGKGRYYPGRIKKNRDISEENTTSNIPPVTSTDHPTSDESAQKKPLIYLSVNYSYQTEWKFRSGLWKQVFQAIVDIPILFIALMNILTLWRCYEMFYKINRYIRSQDYPGKRAIRAAAIAAQRLPQTQAAVEGEIYQEIHSVPPVSLTPLELLRDIIVNEDDEKIRGIIFQQFLYVLRDFLCCFPLLLILVTLYRAPGLLMALITKARERVLTNIEPLWDVLHCSLEYKEGKDPVMTFRLKPNPKNPLTKGSSADKTSFGEIELKNYKLQILGKEMWEEAGNLFGGFLINLAKSFLPLKFKEGETIGWNKSPGEVRKRKEQKPGDAKEEKISRNKAVNYEPIRQNSIEEREEKENEKVDFEGESFSPLARVIVSQPLIIDSSDLPSSIPVEVKEETKNEEEETVESEISFVLPLKQVKPKTLIKNVQQFQKTTRCLFQIECQGKGGTTTTTTTIDQLQWKDHILFQFPFALTDLIPIAKSGQGVFPTTRTSSTTSSRLPPAEKITIDESHFVDQFHGMILTTFFELLLDLGHFFLYFFTLSNPWRFYQLTRSLLSKNYYFIDYLVTQIGKEVQQMHEHLYAYRSSIAPIFNHVAKMETANRGAFQSWSYTLFSRYSYYYRYYDAYQPIVCSEESLLEEERVDDLERYAELGKAVFHSAQFLKKIYHPASSDDPIEKEARSLAAIEEKAEEVFALHDQMMTVWLLRYGNWIFLNRDPITRKQKDLLNIVMSERHDGVVRKMIRTKNEFEDYIETKKQMLLGLEPKEKKPIAKKEVSKRKRALFVNSIGETREIIRYFARKTFNDFGSLCLLILLFFTVVRLFPLFRDYYKDTIKYSSSSSSSPSTSTSPSTASFTFHLKRQVGLLYIDVKDFLIFLFYFLILCITAVALPAFLSDVFQSHNLSSMKRLKICAKMHCNDFFWRLCEVLCLCFAFKTYKIAFKSTFYVLLLPSAGIAEALSLLKASTGIFVRFGLGILIYAGLFIGSVLVILQAIAIGDHSSDERDAVFQVNYSLFTIIIVTTMVMILLAWLKRHHQSRINPQGSTISSVPSAAGTTAKVMQTVSFQWSLWNHLISFIVPMTDCIQLSAVILFFFWNAVTPTNGNTNNNANTTSSSSYFLLDISNTHFGEDNLSILMYWSRQHSLLSSEISRETYNTGMTIAAVFGLIYILLVTLPIAYGGESEETRRREKILEIRNQNFYHILLILFQHFFTIWMLAMWMRPFSCLINNGQDNAEEDTLVLSTAFSVSCGGTDVWSSRLSLVLLTYYLITSFVFYIEDRPSDTPTTAAATATATATSTATATAAAAQRRRRNNASWGNRKIASRDELKLEHQLVYYDISYNILIKGYYTLMIMFCYVFFGIVPSSIILVIMMVFSLFVAFYPFLFSSFLVQSHLSPGGKSSNAKGSWLDRMNAYCTVPSLLPVRSCTFLGISWTCMICLIRITASNHAIFHQTVIFASEWVIYIGWILLFLLAAFLSRKVEDANAARWKDYLVQNGFTEVISGLERIYRHALIDSNCSTIMASSKPKKIDTKRILGQFSNRFQLTGQKGKSELESEESSKSNNPKRTNDHTPLMNYLEHQLFHQIRNERDLIYLLLQLEENISVEQLSTAFYQQRADWIQSLVDLANNPQPLLATSNTTSQPAPQRTITSQPTAIGLPNQQWDEFDTDAPAVVGPGGVGGGAALGNTHVANATNVVLIPDIHDIENPRDSFTSKNQVQLLPSLSLLLNHMTILRTSLEDTIATTTLSWKLLEIVLSFHLPRDCCYVIHSFLIDVKEIHQFLFQEVFSTYQTLPLLYRVNNKSNKKKIPYGAWTGGNGFVNFTKDYYQTRNYLQETYGRLTQLYSNGSLQTKLIELFNKKNLF